MAFLSRLSLSLRFLPISGPNLCNRHLRCHWWFNGLLGPRQSHTKSHTLTTCSEAMRSTHSSSLFCLYSVHGLTLPFRQNCSRESITIPYCHLINAERILTHKGPPCAILYLVWGHASTTLGASRPIKIYHFLNFSVNLVQKNLSLN